jgi:penicillin-binding protein 2
MSLLPVELDLDTPAEGGVRSGWRWTILSFVFLGPLLLIAGRLIHVQAVLADRYVAVWEGVIEREEPVPARQGRIITADGAVLADVRPQYNLLVNYRWLQDPPHPDWLRREASSRLPRAERRNPAALAAAQSALLEERAKLWSELQGVLQWDEAQLTSQRERIQARVERMRGAVERQREARRAARQVRALDWSAGWQGIWETLLTELTSEPERVEQPLVLREEITSHRLATDIRETVALEIASWPARFRGAEVELTEVRRYPQGDAASHLLGLRTSSAVNETPQTTGGLERTYAPQLLGQAGTQLVIRSRQGELLETRLLSPPEDGLDLQLSLDLRLQRGLEQLLDSCLRPAEFIPGKATDDPAEQRRARGGVALVMDLWTGQLRAAAVAPRVAPELLLNPTEAEWTAVLNDPRAPLFNRLTRSAVPPGELMRLPLSLAALAAGVTSPEESYVCEEVEYHEGDFRTIFPPCFPAAHGEVTLTTALAFGCRGYFADRAGRLPPVDLLSWCTALGWGARTGIDLPGEQSGEVPDVRKWPQLARGTTQQTRQLAGGQVRCTVTPLQILRMMAVIGNGGLDVIPSIAQQAAIGPNTPRAATGNSRITPGRFDPEVLQVLRQGLQEGVLHPAGAAHAAYEPELPAVGIVANAQAGEDKPPHAWFAGYAPIAQPRVAVVVLLEEAGNIAQAAALAREILIRTAECGYLPIR